MVPLEELTDVDFLQGLGPGHVRQLAGMAQLKEVPPDTVLFREWQHGDHIYLVLRGEVALEVRIPGRGDVAVQTVGPGDLLGWSPALGGGAMTATARAVTWSRLAALDARQLQQAWARDPALGMECLRRIAVAVSRRLDALRRQLRTANRSPLYNLALEEGGTD
jgi:CRP-like cAMP-binding protein